jgi:hypothetical protein
VLPQPLVQKSFYNLQNCFFPKKCPCHPNGGKNQENSGKFDANVSLDPTRNRASLHCLKIGQAFKSSHHERICSTYMFMFIQGRKVLDNGGGVEWHKALDGKF